MMREQRLTGVGLARGIGVGRAVCVAFRGQDVFRVPLRPEQVPAEIDRLEKAVNQAQQEVRSTREVAARSPGAELQGIFEAQELILLDPVFVQGVEETICNDGVNAEWAVLQVADTLERRFQALDTPYLRERSDLLLDVSRVLLRQLQGLDRHELSEIEDQFVIVAHDLTPSEALRLGRLGPTAIAVETVGRTSHTTIVARSLHIPLVGGLPDLLERVTADDVVLVDGGRGELILHPSAESIAAGRELSRKQTSDREQLAASSRGRTETRDGVEVVLTANIDLLEEAAEVEPYGATGIGLYRSEFLYLERSPELPSEVEQLAAYRTLLESVAPEQVVVRSYDLGEHKLGEGLLASEEHNPALGVRGVRLTSRRPNLFRPQLRALLRAGAIGNLAVLLPMVSSVEEIHRFRHQLADAAEGLAREGIPHRADLPIGAMIEVPAAALIADRIAAEVDFLSIGSNDLVQYTLAVDRSNENVEALYAPCHPAVLSLISAVVEAARQQDVEVSLCGEIAADILMAPLLVGLGLRRLSMSPLRVPELKTLLASMDSAEAKAVACRCLSMATAAEVREFVTRWVETHLEVEVRP